MFPDWSRDALPEVDRRQFLGAACAGLATASGSYPNVGPKHRIETWTDLDAIREYPDREYVLVTDLDETTAGYEEHVADPDSGWQPIGTEKEPFAGRFDGNGYEIAGLRIDRPDESYVGLFGGCYGAVIDVSLTDCIVSGKDNVGGLAGNVGPPTDEDDFEKQLPDSEFRRMFVRGTSVTGEITGDKSVGGLVGYCVDSTVRRSSASAAVSGTDDVGGLIGVDYSTRLQALEATGPVRGESGVGGLIGDANSGEMRDLSASGSVHGEGAVGGLFGSMSGRAQNVSAGGSVTGSKPVGGLAGYARDVVVTDATAHGSVSGNEDVGGLVGRSVGNEFQNVDASGDAEGREFVGGVAGWSRYDELRSVAASGDIDGTEYVGGLVGGFQNGNIRTAATGGTVVGTEHVGGLAGGLFGESHFGTFSHVRSVSVTSDVSGERIVGGLAGRLSLTTLATAAVSGRVSGVRDVGGVAGSSEAEQAEHQNELTDTLVTTTVVGDTNVGGLLGRSERGTIERTLVAGSVHGNQPVAGIIGKSTKPSSLSGVYWDSEAIDAAEAIGDGDSDGRPVGLDSAQAKGASAREHMPALDFSDTWTVVTGPSGYPTLTALDTVPTVES